jgi:RND family efflux transporter MFP subunit
MLVLGGVTAYSVPGVTKPIKGFFATTKSDLITYTVRKMRLDQTVVERGTLESSKNEDVYCNVEGQVTIISIEPEGKPVTKGQVVCVLDSAALKDQLTNQKITTKSAEANHETARLTREVAEISVIEYEQGIYVQDEATVNGEITLAESDLSRQEDRVDWARRMHEKGYVSLATKVSEELALKKAQFALDQAKTKKTVLVDFTKKKTVKELKSEVEKSLSDELAKKATWELEVSKEKKLEKQIAACELRAPNDGLVVYANDPNRSFMSNQPQIEEGATVRERQKIFSLPDISRMQVNAKIHETETYKIAPGLKATVRVESFADQELAGTVVDIAPLPDPSSWFSSDIKLYTAHVRIDKPLPGLRPGMSAVVTIMVDRRDSVLAVPVNAILQYNGKDHVTKRIGDRYERVEVALGPSNERYVQVTEGVNEGDVLILNPGGLLSEEERRELFGSASKVAKKGAEGAAEGAPGAPGAAAGPAGAAKGLAKADGKPGEPGIGKGKGQGKGAAKKKGFAPPPWMKKVPQADRRKLFMGSDEERQEILNKAKLTPEEASQAQQFFEQMKARMQGGGGFGGGGGPPGGGGGPPGGGGSGGAQ